LYRFVNRLKQTMATARRRHAPPAAMAGERSTNRWLNHKPALTLAASTTAERFAILHLAGRGGGG
jgi:hypothetical protein